MGKLLNKLGGKKMAALVAYMLVTLLKTKLDIDAETYAYVCKTLMAYFVAQGFADGVSKGATSHA